LLRPTSRQRCDNLLRLFAEELIPQIAPPPDIKISDWADENVVLGPDVSSHPGPWRTDFAPYQRRIMDVVNDPNVRRFVVMKAARTGITYSAMLCPIAYYIKNDPCPFFVVYPTEQLAKKFSKKYLSPLIRDCAPIRELVHEQRSRDGNNTLMLKMFPGGSITLAGANSPNSLRMDTAKIVFIDEADGEVDLREGDYIKLAETRIETYMESGGKVGIISTPKNKGESLIEDAYNDSSKEKFYLPCPSCGEMQTLEWPQLDLETCKLSCVKCEALHNKLEWTENWEKTGTWIAENPDHPTPGFHVNSLYSPFSTWEYLANEWREAVAAAEIGQFGKLQVFINTKLGETWEIRGEQIDESGLMKRREAYFFDPDMNRDPTMIPDGVCALTIGVDVQNNRLEYEVVGWGAGRESWGIEYDIIPGDPRIPGSPVWGLLDDVIRKPRKYANGVPVPVVCTCIDYGGGEGAPDQTAGYAKARARWRVWPVRGVGGFGKLFVDLRQTFKTKVANAIGLNLGVDTG
jgi:phage terminase large subunit GpA-like protein